MKKLNYFSSSSFMIAGFFFAVGVWGVLVHSDTTAVISFADFLLFVFVGAVFLGEVK